MTTAKLIQVVDYDPGWPGQFQRLWEWIWPSVNDLAIAIEHVGSTSVPGLAAKPVLDLDVVIPSRRELAAVVECLSTLGYEDIGDLGIEDREAFRSPEGHFPHHLYVCPRSSIALRNHLTLRDHLRNYPTDRAAYGSLKRELAQRFSRNVAQYVEGKSEFILSILAQYEFCGEDLSAIRAANQHH